MAKMLDPYLLLDGIDFSIDGCEVRFSCPCPKHKNRNQYNSSLNLSTGEFICFGLCKTVFSKGKILDFITWLRNDCSVSSKISWIDANEISKKSKEEYDWNNLLKLPLALGNEYLFSRGIDDDLIREFDIRANEDRIVFPNTDLNGKIIGVNIRYLNRKMRYQYFGERIPLYRMHKLKEYDKSKPLVITEGVFGALKGRKFGHQTTCLLGTGGLKNKAFLEPFETILVGLDKDEAGLVMAEKITKDRRLNIWLIEPQEYDELGDVGWKEAVEGLKFPTVRLYKETWFD